MHHAISFFYLAVTVYYKFNFMKVYTKTGDKGTTALIGGKRVSKNHSRLDAYGTIDELMAYTGLLRDQLINKEDQTFFLEILDRLMTVATILAADCDDCHKDLPNIIQKDIEKLEKSMDNMNKELPELSFFVLPGGHTTVSFCHIARTVCRRAERLAIKVQEDFNNCEMAIKYLNRLSDYFFVLSRKLTKDLKIEEIRWIPRT